MIDVERLYREQAFNLRGFVVKRLRTGDDDRIDDLCSDVWAKVWARRHQYRDRGHEPTGWLLCVARSVMVDDIRRRATQKRGAGAPLDTVNSCRATLDAGSDRHVESIDTTTLLTIDRLTVEQRRVIACRFLLGMSELETSSATGHTYGAVKKLQRRALINLRKHLGIAA